MRREKLQESLFARLWWAKWLQLQGKICGGGEAEKLEELLKAAGELTSTFLSQLHYLGMSNIFFLPLLPPLSTDCVQLQLPVRTELTCGQLPAADRVHPPPCHPARWQRDIQRGAHHTHTRAGELHTDPVVLLSVPPPGGCFTNALLELLPWSFPSLCP